MCLSSDAVVASDAERRYECTVSEGRRGWTAFGAFVFVVVGFFAGATSSAWLTRDQRVAPWRKLRVEHEGTDGQATRTRVVFENPKLPLQAIEVLRDADGEPELARIALRNGTELTASYSDGRPASLEGPKGTRAIFSFKGEKARVAFFNAKGTEVGNRVVRVPVGLRRALALARQDPDGDERHASWSLIGEAWAQEDSGKKGGKPDPKINVERRVEVELNITVPKGKDDGSGKAQIDANCEPFTCLPVTKDVRMPGKSTVIIAVSGNKKRSELDEPKSASSLGPFKKSAKAERKTATRVLPDASAAIAAVGVAAIACRSLKLNWTLCVKSLGKNGNVAGAAIASVSAHEVKTRGREVDKRAEALYYEEQARKALDKKVTVEICASRDGYARACTKIAGRPLGDTPMDGASARVKLRRGIGGTLQGNFVLTQSDGADCKFSPSPRTTGPMKMSFDNEKGVLTAALKSEANGTRPNLRCSAGNANMRWSQSYTVTATETFTPQQLQSGGKLPLKMKGTMKGIGSYSFSNCRRGGVSGNCPTGKREPYSYPVEVNGFLDLDTRKGTGRIIVSQAPLGTRGTWQIPGGGGTR